MPVSVVVHEPLVRAGCMFFGTTARRTLTRLHRSCFLVLPQDGVVLRQLADDDDGQILHLPQDICPEQKNPSLSGTLNRNVQPRASLQVFLVLLSERLMMTIHSFVQSLFSLTDILQTESFTLNQCIDKNTRLASRGEGLLVCRPYRLACNMYNLRRFE